MLAPILASNLADSSGYRNESVRIRIAEEVFFKALIAGAHSMQCDQHHRQMIGEKKGKFRTEPPRTSQRPLESGGIRWGVCRANRRAR
jgi:hypothetical protein